MSIINHAKRELAATNFGEEDSAVMIEILEKFFSQWDSGGAVWCVAPVLQRLIAGKPLGPLTGEDSEWMEVGEDASDRIWQNIRCGTVFKTQSHYNGEVRCYDIDVEGRPNITFPYSPERNEVSSPVVNIEVWDK